MMATDDIAEQTNKEKERVEKLYLRLIQYFEQFFETMKKDCNDLNEAYDHLRKGK